MILTINFTFSDSTEWTFDSTKINFDETLEQISLQSQFPDNVLMLCTFNSDLDADYSTGTGTGTGFNDPEIVAGGKWNSCLDLAQNDIRYVQYESTGNINFDEGFIKVYVKPNYTGSPANSQIIWSVFQDDSNNNTMFLRHASSGGLDFLVYDSSNVNRVALSYSWSADTNWHEIGIGYDNVNKDYYLFLDGVLVASYSASPFTIINTWDSMRLGKQRATVVINLYIDEFIIYDELLHTTDYTPESIELTYPYYYNSTVPAINPNAYTDRAKVKSLTVTGTNTDDVGYTYIAGTTEYYYDGSGFSVTTGYTNSNTETEFIDNLNDFINEYGEYDLSFKMYLYSSNLTTPILTNLAFQYYLTYTTLENVRLYLPTTNTIKSFTDTVIQNIITLASDFVFYDLTAMFTKTQLEEWGTLGNNTPEPIQRLTEFKCLELLYKQSSEMISINERTVLDVTYYEERYKELLNKVFRGQVSIYDVNDDDSVLNPKEVITEDYLNLDGDWSVFDREDDDDY